MTRMPASDDRSGRRRRVGLPRPRQRGAGLPLGRRLDIPRGRLPGGLRPAPGRGRGIPPVGQRADQQAGEKDDEDQQVKRQRERVGQDRIEVHLDRRPIENRENDQDCEQKNAEQNAQEAHDGASFAYSTSAVCLDGRFSFWRNSLPVLKKGTNFSATSTAAPVRGLRPVREGRRFTENAPKPRNSTRSPRDRALAISSKIVPTMRSISRWVRC